MFILATPAGDIIISLLVLAAIVIATYFLIKSVIKEEQKNREEKNLMISGLASKAEMNSIIAMYLNRMGEDARYSLIYLDLDKFGDLALAFGKKDSELILRAVASRIKSIIPKGSYASKYHDDEFLLFFPGSYSNAEVLNYANKILTSFNEQLELANNKKIDLKTSVAVAYYPLHGLDLKDMMAALNLTIYRIKKEGGNDLKVYSEDLKVNQENIDYYFQIKDAIADREFKYNYSPIYNLETNKIYGVESKLKWEHKEHGLIPHHKFIHLLEQSSDIHWVGIWGFEELVKLYLEIRERQVDVPKLAINLTPKQLYNEELSKEFNNILKRARVAANNFVLEIGEFALFESQEMIINNIIQLQKLGFDVAIDGFGLDMATFEKLEKLNIYYIKVNYEFIQEDSFIVKKHLEILQEYTKEKGNIIVQGIKDELAFQRVKSLNIIMGQGLFISNNVSNIELLKLLNEK